MRTLMIVLAATLLAAILLTGCATQEPMPGPDFYDRNGVACWRELDFVWCDDGYESESEIEPEATMTRLTYRFHTHTWSKQSETTDDNGKMVCIWTCFSDSSHVAVTSGYGYCSYPN